MQPDVIPLAHQLIDAGAGQDNFFNALESRMSMAVREQGLIADNKQVLAQIHVEIDALVEAVKQDAEASLEGTETAISSGRSTVGIIGVVSLIAIFVIAGLFGLRRKQP